MWVTTLVHSHARRFAQVSKRRRQVVLLRAALELVERLPALPVARHHEAVGIVRVARAASDERFPGATRTCSAISRHTRSNSGPRPAFIFMYRLARTMSAGANLSERARKPLGRARPPRLGSLRQFNPAASAAEGDASVLPRNSRPGAGRKGPGGAQPSGTTTSCRSRRRARASRAPSRWSTSSLARLSPSPSGRARRTSSRAPRPSTTRRPSSASASSSRTPTSRRTTRCTCSPARLQGDVQHRRGGQEGGRGLTPALV